ncbi:ribosomal protein S6 kinase alpha-5-like isoform X2 [Zootermopsis nevadensis]|uniref:ribosomal protein S6 kinase alpha-5-like isoform X2 n=1 Tax=Zootermopsis nevadensis TaxID=136037 RepID=UPI000B8ED11A|nr:ribosomal protein S6 kinase alpha-5-like isoform X2 [Zootermopsis nevadensis]
MCLRTMENVETLIDDLIGAGKKEKCGDQILAEPLFMILNHFARMEKELSDLRERNRDVEDLRAKVKDLENQHVIEMRITHGTINGLIQVVSNIMAENEDLKQQIQSFRGCHHQELAPASSENWDEDCSENWDEDCSGQGADQGRLDEADLPRLKDFEPLQLLGTGGYGKVYLVRKVGGVDDGTKYALKTQDINEIMSCEAFRQQYRTERELLEKGLEAPFMVGLYYSFETQSNLCLVQDYYAGTGCNLFDLLWELGGMFTVDESRMYLAEIIEAVEYLHKLRVIHRDLKPENILVDIQGHIAVADYGLCKQFVCSKEGDRAYSQCGTSQYMAPEIFIGEGYSYEVDWWSVGVTAFVMMVGHRPFEYDEHQNDSALCCKILHDKPDIPLWFLDCEVDLIERMLKKNPRLRLGGGKRGAQEIKEHPFFDGINWGDVSKRQLRMPHSLDFEWEGVSDIKHLGEHSVSFLSPGDESGNNEGRESDLSEVLL